jgi:hypothetical protein
MAIFSKQKIIGLGLNFEVVFGVCFLSNFRDTLDFTVLDPTLNITGSRLMKFPKHLKFGAPALMMIDFKSGFGSSILVQTGS